MRPRKEISRIALLGLDGLNFAREVSGKYSILRRIMIFPAMVLLKPYKVSPAGFAGNISYNAYNNLLFNLNLQFYLNRHMAGQIHRNPTGYNTQYNIQYNNQQNTQQKTRLITRHISQYNTQHNTRHTFQDNTRYKTQNKTKFHVRHISRHNTPYISQDNTRHSNQQDIKPASRHINRHFSRNFDRLFNVQMFHVTNSLSALKTGQSANNRYFTEGMQVINKNRINRVYTELFRQQVYKYRFKSATDAFKSSGYYQLAKQSETVSGEYRVTIAQPLTQKEPFINRDKPLIHDKGDRGQGKKPLSNERFPVNTGKYHADIAEYHILHIPVRQVSTPEYISRSPYTSLQGKGREAGRLSAGFGLDSYLEKYRLFRNEVLYGSLKLRGETAVNREKDYPPSEMTVHKQGIHNTPHIYYAQRSGYQKDEGKAPVKVKQGALQGQTVNACRIVSNTGTMDANHFADVDKNIDVNRIADRVYQVIERKIRIERERRGV